MNNKKAANARKKANNWCDLFLLNEVLVCTLYVKRTLVILFEAIAFRVDTCFMCDVRFFSLDFKFYYYSMTNFPVYFRFYFSQIMSRWKESKKAILNHKQTS